MAAAAEPVVQVRSTFLPIYIEATLQTPNGKKYLITPLLPRYQDAAENFYRTTSAPYFRDGKPYPEGKIASRIQQLIERFLNGEPWSSYLIHDAQNGQLAGYFNIGYDETPGDLHLAMLLAPEYRRQKIATAVWKWTTEHLLPEMHERNIPVRGKRLLEAKIRTLAHPEHEAMLRGVEKAGFQFVKKVDDFGGRNLYEINALRFIIAAEQKKTI